MKEKNVDFKDIKRSSYIKKMLIKILQKLMDDYWEKIKKYLQIWWGIIKCFVTNAVLGFEVGYKSEIYKKQLASSNGSHFLCLIKRCII